jgi:hypothetical protein
MSSSNYRRLLTNLPSMAVVVNAFQSPDVQLAVYQKLIRELDSALDEGGPRTAAGSGRTPPSEASRGATHDVIEGDSIHGLAADE